MTAADLRSVTVSEQAPERAFGVDCVYFLMFDGWKHELTSNRWHYALRWSRHLPVVMLQPNQIEPRLANEPEPEERIANCELLSIRATGETTYAADALIQAGQVYDHMVRRGYSRPLLWCYNPNLAGLYAALPAAARVYHATENYFHFNGLSDFFFEQLRAAITISDAVLAVSDGVAASIRGETGRDDVTVVTNGCDRAFYRGDTVDDELASFRARFDRIAVYAGNINGRVDFDLLAKVADAHPSTLLAFYGPLSPLDEHDERLWAQLRLNPNVNHFGPVQAARLPRLYRAADVGFIPYKHERSLVENGFPLKALEMGATGLPVVSTYMKPIVGLAEAVVVTETDDEFTRAFGATDRRRVSPQALVELAAVCDANDYDAKFAAVTKIVAATTSARGDKVTTAVDETLARLGLTTWLDGCRQYWHLAAVPETGPGASSRVAHLLVRAARPMFARPLAFVARVLPRGVIDRLPRGLRRAARRVVVG